MENQQIIGVNHTSFTVSNLARSVKFFSEVFGFQITSHESREPEMIQAITGIMDAEIDVAYLQGPGHALELIQYIKPIERGRADNRLCDVGVAHIALDVIDVNALVCLAKSYNVSLVGKIVEVSAGPNKGSKAAYLRDLDGIIIELIQASSQIKRDNIKAVVDLSLTASGA